MAVVELTALEPGKLYKRQGRGQPLSRNAGSRTAKSTNPSPATAHVDFPSRERQPSRSQPGAAPKAAMNLKRRLPQSRSQRKSPKPPRNLRALRALGGSSIRDRGFLQPAEAKPVIEDSASLQRPSRDRDFRRVGSEVARYREHGSRKLRHG
jgi:hypothetical protein